MSWGESLVWNTNINAKSAVGSSLAVDSRVYCALTLASVSSQTMVLAAAALYQLTDSLQD